MSINLFYLSAHSEDDQRLLDEIKNFLEPLRKIGLIKDWERRLIQPGQPVRAELLRQLDQAQIIMILLSPDLLTDPFYPELCKRAWERLQQGSGRVRLFPVKLRECLYEPEPFAELAIFPSDGRPLRGLSASQREKELTKLARKIREVALELVGGEEEVKRPPAIAAASEAISSVGVSLEADNAAWQGRTSYVRPSGMETRRCDVLLVTATDVEIRAVREIALKEMQATFERQRGRVESYYFLGEIGGTATWVLRTQMGTSGASGATLAISDAIRTLKPEAVIMVGIAFGLQRDKQQLGDILVSQQLMSYELQRVGMGASGKRIQLPRGDRASASPRLLARFTDAVLDWQGAKTHFGLILSGDKLVDHPEMIRQLLTIEPEAIGGEMEGAGLYAAAMRERCEWIVVKAICDWGDGHKGENKEENQRRAAENAARFVFFVLGQGGLAPRKPS
ncbi:TIR domain-containing protein [Thermogemmatispora sp.]|uniref:phosphorylase family protein n=1 Tax=Thermogemmatispora sp. TaxID=1968838 RepID=UPI0035E45962